MVLIKNAWTTLVTVAVNICRDHLARGRYRLPAIRRLPTACSPCGVAGRFCRCTTSTTPTSPLVKKMGTATPEPLGTLFSPAFLLGLLAVVFVSSLLGPAGQKMPRKHFMRAGIA